VLIIDEAGMVGSRQIAQLIEYAERRMPLPRPATAPDQTYHS